MTLEFTDTNFETEVLQNEGITLVDFWAPWCGPCQVMGPIIDEIAQTVKGKFKIGKLNVDENQTIAQKYGVMSIPTLLVIKNGKVLKQLVGIQSKESLIKELNNA